MLNVAVFVFGFTWWSVRWTVALVVFVAVMAGAGYYVFSRASAGGGYVTVPDIVGKSIMEASYVLAERGLSIGRQETRPNDQVPPYHVISQLPPAGKVVRTGRHVYPIVSKGPDFRPAPNLTLKLLDPAIDMIQRNDFRLGSIARIPHREPSETVIGQDPPPGRDLVAGGKIHLLVSQGASPRNLYMPNLMGRSLQEVMDLLAPLGVNPVPIMVDRADAPFDVVIEQRPEAGSLVGQGQTVTFEIRPSDSLPSAWRKEYVEYTVPQSWTARAVRMELVERNGSRAVLFPRPEDSVDAQPPRFTQGTKIRVPFPMRDEATIDVYLDEERVRSYYFSGSAEPVVTKYDGSGGGIPGAETQDRTIYPGQ
ncbi:MAG: PASTA domain-containing protein [Candidatus Hydrogenedentes bacterium]|nr:PASTA domain-containing protein [Candidatus Hydrogenedentota bacterium]